MVVQDTETDDVIDEEYRPIYEYDEDAGPSYQTTGAVVCKVPREPQIQALKVIQGQGPVEPDGWFEGYNGGSLPVIDGVPLPILEMSKTVSASSEGAESTLVRAVEDVGHVTIYKAFAHPGNTSKIKVEAGNSDD
jgi:hypothetical protein